MSQKTFCDACDKEIRGKVDYPEGRIDIGGGLTVSVVPILDWPIGKEHRDICEQCILDAMHDARILPKLKQA